MYSKFVVVYILIAKCHSLSLVRLRLCVCVCIMCVCGGGGMHGRGKLLGWMDGGTQMKGSCGRVGK